MSISLAALTKNFQQPLTALPNNGTVITNLMVLKAQSIIKFVNS